ncbi:37S ribosomal protein S4-like, mitochondrial [Hypsizygus marmoreus]|uniref:37S ribosomal protein S4-like, mitochondrial n=1 Tax=Hypsizygus marmoreus TaxID=39966 RepID=A0A369JZR9_HYPMA|nr:37S ribosomal protein S4-like, mitochondrial [Hypsizygus marmoreus]
MRDAGIFSIKRALPRMSWSPKNLFNLYARTVGERRREITFRSANSTLFQQRWKSKAVVRAYHGDFINEKIFKRWYLPETLPDVRPRRKVLGDDKASLEEFALRRKKEQDLAREEEKKGMAPVGSLMFSEVERRIDVFLFRCCFAHSVYEARRLVIHGDVLLNGKKHQNSNTRLAPGDMVSVNPNAIRFFKPPNGEFDDVNGYNEKLAAATRELESNLQSQKARKGATEAAPPSDAPTPAEQALLDAAASVKESTSDETTAATEDAPAKDAKEVVEATPEPGATEVTKPDIGLTPFYLPPYASPWLFIPAYIEPSFATCSAIYVRHPTARPGYSEIPTPYDADGEVVRFAWEWYVQRRPRVRTKAQLARMPEDRALAQLDVDEGRRRLRKDILKIKAARSRI